MSNRMTRRQLKAAKRLDLDAIEPIELNTPEEDEQADVEMIHVLTLDGEEIYIPSEVPANQGLRFAWELGTNGEVAATVYAMNTIFGADVFKKLVDHPAITEDIFSKLVAICVQIIDGANQGKES